MISLALILTLIKFKIIFQKIVENNGGGQGGEDICFITVMWCHSVTHSVPAFYF